MRQCRILLLAMSLLAGAVPALAAGRVQCGVVKSRFVPRPVGYCALLPPSYDPEPKRKFAVLYLLHGLGGDQSMLVTSGGWNLIEDAWEQKKLPEFVIITPDADNSFYINSKNGRVKYESFFIREFVPEMEKTFRLTGTRATRGIGGMSMGGYGALRFAFKYPQMFAVVGAHMPALLEELPRGAGNAGLSAFLGTAFGSPADETFWKTNTPFVYARTDNLRNLKIYFDCGDQDDYGFDAGAKAMDKLLTSRHIPHEFHIYPGRHDWEFVAAHLLESLKFDAKGMGLSH